MKTKKIRVLSYLLTVGLLTLFISCSMEDNADSNTDYNEYGPLKNIPEEILAVGKYHNEGLDFAFQTIRDRYSIETRNGQKLNFTKEALMDISKQSMYDFCKQNEYFGCDLNFHQIILEETNDDSEKTRATNDLAYSPELQSLLNELKTSIFNVKADEVGKLRYKMDELALKAQNTLSETELTAFYAGIATACASMEYWTKNHQKWQIALNCPELLLTFNDTQLNELKIKNGKLISPAVTRSWWDDAWSSLGETWEATSGYVQDWWYNGGGKEVVGTDAGAAVAGAIDGAIKGAAFGGVGAGPGAIAGGLTAGTYGSIGAAITWWIAN